MNLTSRGVPNSFRRRSEAFHERDSTRTAGAEKLERGTRLTSEAAAAPRGVRRCPKASCETIWTNIRGHLFETLRQAPGARADMAIDKMTPTATANGGTYASGCETH